MNLSRGDGCDDLGLTAYVSLHNTRAARSGKEQPEAKRALAAPARDGFPDYAGFGEKVPVCPVTCRQLAAPVAGPAPHALSRACGGPPRSAWRTRAAGRTVPVPNRPAILSTACSASRQA